MHLNDYTLSQLKQLRARIEKEIAKQQSAGKDALLKKFKQMAREHGLALEDLSLSDDVKRPKAQPAQRVDKPRAAVAVKYQHPSNKELKWTGRGRKPRWVEAWLANGGSLDALATAAAKLAKKQQRAAAAPAKPVAPDAVPQVEVAAPAN